MENRGRFTENLLLEGPGTYSHLTYSRPEFQPLVTPLIPLVTRSSPDPDAAGHDTQRKEKTMKLFSTALLVLKMMLVLTVLPCSADETAINKAVARRVYEEGLSRGIFTVPYTDDFVGHGGSRTFTHEDGMNEAKGWRSAFPDLHVTADLIIAEGDLVAVRWTARGTNTGAGNGIPATGRKVEVSGTAIFRFVDGKIAEEWTSANTLGLLKQLGLR